LTTLIADTLAPGAGLSFGGAAKGYSVILVRNNQALVTPPARATTLA